MRKSKIVLILSIPIISFILSLWFYPLIPKQMASHWDIRGNPDGYLDKSLFFLLVPGFILAISLLAYFLPRIDPRYKNIEKFKEYFENFILALLLFLLYIFLLTIAWNLGIEFQFARAMLPALAMLLYFIGELLKHAQPNWTVGIRTPWTLTDEKVWQKTHILGGKVFKLAALFSLLMTLLPKLSFWLFLILVLGASLFLVIFSYWEYQKLHCKE
jgi:uncharacterized membrane protein